MDKEALKAIFNQFLETRFDIERDEAMFQHEGLELHSIQLFFNGKSESVDAIEIMWCDEGKSIIPMRLLPP